MADFADNLLLGVITDGTSIQDYNGGAVGIGSLRVTNSSKLINQKLGIKLVHLAAHGFDVKVLIHIIIITILFFFIICVSEGFLAELF